MANEVSALLRSLNQPQRQAVEHTDGPILVLAGAGSGKTRVITTRVAYLIATGKARPEEILAVTFTNKAANEMRERVAAITGKKAAKAIVISTFHSFCLRILREHITHLGYRRDFTISSESDKRTLLRRLLDDMDGVKERFKPEMFIEAIGTLKNNGQEPDEASQKEPETETEKKYQQWLPSIYGAYQSALRAANALDFDDLLGLTLKLWRDHPEVLEAAQQRFRYVMVDEFQDTNQVQYQLVRSLVDKHQNLCVVGDDDQSIYAWRGADPRNILELDRDFPKLRVIKLEQNYRSTQTVLDAANGVIQHNRWRREKKLWSDNGAGRPIDWIVCGDEEHEAKMAASWLRLIQSKTGAACSDFAVLYRSNTQSRAIEIAFRNAGIPYVVIGGQEFFERAEVRDIVSYLKVIANPRDETAFLRIANVPRRGIGDVTLHKVHDCCIRDGLPFGKALAKVVEEGGASSEAAKGIRSLLALLAEHRKRFHAGQEPLSRIAHDLVDAIGYRDELLRSSKTPGQFETRWNNVEAIFQAIDSYENEDETPSLGRFLDQTSLVRDEDRRSKNERRDTGTTLMTMHSAKGLEFPFVFVIGMEEGILPHEKSMRDDAIEEERRLFYVAITRAKRHLTVFECLSRNRFGKERMSATSRFLSEIPENLVKRNIAAARDMVEARVAPPKPKPKKSNGGARARR